MFTFNKSSYKTFRQLQHAIIHVLQKHSTRETVQNTLSNSSIKRRLDFFLYLKIQSFSLYSEMWSQIFSWAFWGTNETKKCYELNVTHSIWNRTSEHKPRNSLSSSGLSFITLTREVSEPIWRKNLNGAAKGTPNALLFLIVLQKFQQVQSSEKKNKAKSVAEEYNKCM